MFDETIIKAPDARTGQGGETIIPVDTTPGMGWVDYQRKMWMCPSCKHINTFETEICDNCEADARDMLFEDVADSPAPGGEQKRRVRERNPLPRPSARLVSGVICLIVSIPTFYLLLAFSSILIYFAPLFLVATIVFIAFDKSHKKKHAQ